LFTQSARDTRKLALDWQLRFVDYLYVALTNSTAFSPTDTMPLSRRAKIEPSLLSRSILVPSAREA
jgi:hypothetical protein